MPARKTKIGSVVRSFDARPDRIDFRDRSYLPPLKSLPQEYPSSAEIKKWISQYKKADLILDQGQEGACTGFGLAATINHLYFRLQAGNPKLALPFSPPKASQYMLYRLAQLYDEWPGEDYEGSSCRGAMKGWHKHGVCSLSSWSSTETIDPKWRAEAPQVPLGAYYRIDKDSISDMQSAIYETGAIYVSCEVFDHWAVDAKSQPQAGGFPLIAFHGKPSERGEGGGHAFCIVGYCPEGFIVQNSWGPDWGKDGFAVLAYSEWVQHGSDAWVATLGAPCIAAPKPLKGSAKTSPTLAPATFREAIPSMVAQPSPAAESIDPYEHMLILGNDGGALQNRHIDATSPRDACRKTLYDKPSPWFKESPAKRKDFVLYFHGGLNSENAASLRAAEMGLVFLKKDIYPIFVAWQSGPIETIKHQLGDVFTGLFGRRTPDEGIGDWFAERKRQLREKFDRSVETAARTCGVKALWAEMKENAERSCHAGHGLDLALEDLARLASESGARIHLVGHSAGSILIGRYLEKLALKGLKVASCHLYAPACTVPFALETYLPAIDSGFLSLENLYIDLLTDEREKADNCGSILGTAAYGRSLLYLVSFALETERKTPILGMENAWSTRTVNGDKEYARFEKDIKALVKAFGANGSKLPKGNFTLHGKDRANVRTRSGNLIPLAHGSFDDDELVVDTTIQRIKSAR